LTSGNQLRTILATAQLEPECVGGALILKLYILRLYKPLYEDFGRVLSCGSGTERGDVLGELLILE
jgi:hypothetical protein